ncbi:MAG TPA: hypothetical protein VFZ47_13490 [Chitinophagaceae bacterium]
MSKNPVWIRAICAFASAYFVYDFIEMVTSGQQFLVFPTIFGILGAGYLILELLSLRKGPKVDDDFPEKKAD